MEVALHEEMNDEVPADRPYPEQAASRSALPQTITSARPLGRAVDNILAEEVQVEYDDGLAGLQRANMEKYVPASDVLAEAKLLKKARQKEKHKSEVDTARANAAASQAARRAASK